MLDRDLNDLTILATHPTAKPMTDNFPKRYGPDDVPAGVADAVQRLVPALIAGEEPSLLALREQYARSRIESVELTGVGFYVDFLIPDDVALTNPRTWAGGDAVLTIDTAQNGGGCALFVRDGKLATLDVYTFDDLGWTDQSRVIDIRDVMPAMPVSQFSSS